MKLLLTFALVTLSILSVASAKEWWENGNFYQIYPRSFRDSDGDGIGDLNGVTEKLQYLKDLGFTAAWLSPIFKSPMADFGYDISDFYKIHPEYGTMEDFENMIKKAKEVGIKIILDFVPNHSSDENEWFKKSVNKEPGFENFYVWHPGKKDPTTQKRVPPSNWLSAFRYSAWEWNEIRQEYYLHQFAIKQPDLNYRNPAVVEEMKNVMRFWLKKGISGFRIDACPFLFEIELDPSGNYPDEAVISDVQKCPDENDYCHLNHTLTNDRPETLDMIYQWRELVDQFKKDNGGDSKILLTEAYTSFENMMKYYGNGQRNGSHVPFNFDFLGNVNKNTKAVDVVKSVQKWINTMPKDVYANWVLGNHDNKRVASRFGVERADLLNILLQTLPGNAVTYNGEELAMTDVFISWEDTVDPQACNANPNNFNDYSRDPARTPYQWDASSNAGFTTGPDTWLPVSKDYKTKNALMQMRTPQSHLQIFKKLILLRKEPSFQDKNSMSIKAIMDDIVIYKRQTADSDLYVVILNFGTTDETININLYFNVGSQVEVITTSTQSNYNDGDVVDAKNFIAKAQVGTVVVALNK